jgi:hypothetical protein
MKARLLGTALLLALAAGAATETTEAPAAPELTKLLKEFLDGVSRNDPAVHERFWADDLIYTGSAGRRVGKADILKDVRAVPPGAPRPAVTYAAEDVRIQQYGETAILAFRLVATTTTEGKAEVAQYLNTGTFLRRQGQWQVVAWQATRMAAAEPQPE